MKDNKIVVLGWVIEAVQSSREWTNTAAHVATSSAHPSTIFLSTQLSRPDPRT